MLCPSLEPSRRDGSNEGAQDISMHKYGKLSAIIPVTPSYLKH